MTTPPLRGKRGAERRLGERVAEEFLARHRSTTEDAVDFDVAEADREVEDARRADAAALTGTAEPSRLDRADRPDRAGGGRHSPEPPESRSGRPAQERSPPARPVRAPTAPGWRADRSVRFGSDSAAP